MGEQEALVKVNMRMTQRRTQELGAVMMVSTMGLLGAVISWNTGLIFMLNYRRENTIFEAHVPESIVRLVSDKNSFVDDIWRAVDVGRRFRLRIVANVSVGRHAGSVGRDGEGISRLNGKKVNGNTEIEIDEKEAEHVETREQSRANQEGRWGELRGLKLCRDRASNDTSIYNRAGYNNTTVPQLHSSTAPQLHNSTTPPRFKLASGHSDIATMADPLYELLVPYFNAPSPRPVPSSKDPTTHAYLTRLTTLPLSSLTSSEPQALSQTAHSLLLSLQALSKRSHNAIIDSSTHLSTLSTTLPALAASTASLRDALPKLDDAAIHFSETYNTRSDNALLDRRRKALLLSRNIDRLSDILDLPTLLSSAISTSNASTASTPASSATLNYASALDLNSHIRRLRGLYSDSALISSVEKQAEEAMQEMTTNLIASLKTSSLKLASAMRTISWLRRVAPELDPTPSSLVSTPSMQHGAGASREGSLGSLFLVCRLANLQQMLSALEPLKELADQETLRLQESETNATAEGKGKSKWEGGQQTERYLKRYIEIFREQSFAIISMYRSIFPAGNATHEDSVLKGLGREGAGKEDPLLPLPSSLGTFPLQLVGMLEDTLRQYLGNVRDRSSRDSLLTQVLYCAGSLGRLGGDFSMLLAFQGEHHEEDSEVEEDEEWVEVIRKHRVLAGRLELMVAAKDG